MTSVTVSASKVVQAGLLLLLGLLALGVLVWAQTYPGWPLIAVLPLVGMIIAAAVIVLVGRPVSDGAWLVPASLLLALVLAVGGGITASGVGDSLLRARFDASRTEFEAAVAEAGERPRDVHGTFTTVGGCPARIGSYRVSNCYTIDGGYLFLQQRNAATDDSGFAYLPEGLPDYDEETGEGLSPAEFTHLDGPWYRWSCYC